MIEASFCSLQACNETYVQSTEYSYCHSFRTSYHITYLCISRRSVHSFFLKYSNRNALAYAIIMLHHRTSVFSFIISIVNPYSSFRLYSDTVLIIYDKSHWQCLRSQHLIRFLLFRLLLFLSFFFFFLKQINCYLECKLPFALVNVGIFEAHYTVQNKLGNLEDIRILNILVEHFQDFPQAFFFRSNYDQVEW